MRNISELGYKLLRGMRRLSPMVIVGIALVCLAAADLSYSNLSTRFGWENRPPWWSSIMARFSGSLGAFVKVAQQVLSNSRTALYALVLITLAVALFIFWLRHLGVGNRLRIIALVVFGVYLVAMISIALSAHVELAIITSGLAGASLFGWAQEQARRANQDPTVLGYFRSTFFLAGLAFTLAGLALTTLAEPLIYAGWILYIGGFVALAIVFRRTLIKAAVRFPARSAGVALLFLAGTYVFVSAMAHEDKQGQRTLSIAAGPVTILRELGGLIWKSVEQATKAPIPQVLGLALGVLGIVLLVYLRRSRPGAWVHDIGLALVVPALGWSALLIMAGDLTLAAVSGLLAGICLVSCGSGTAGKEPNPFLVFIPIGVGLMLRFYALGQVPNGYSEHAAGMQVEFSISYLESLKTAMASMQFGPFLKTVSNALLREQFGPFSLLGAIGFEIWGVTLTITRLISATLGTITIYVAYRLGKALDTGRLGLVFAFMLAVSPWHITMSRYGTLEHVLSPLHLLLSLLFLVLAVEGGRIRDIVLAAVFIAASWFVYAPNLVVPIIAGLFLLVRAVLDPKAALHNWRKILLGLGCFAVLSFIPLKEFLPRGFEQRTGYGGGGAVLLDYSKDLKRISLEVDELFRHTDDPWFSIPGGGIGVLQSTLLLPGLAAAVASLRQRGRRDLALLALLGISITALPAIFAPDSSFRRLMPMATLIALLAAFTVIRLEEVARGAGIAQRGLITFAWGAAVALLAVGTFGYFDRVFVGEEIQNAPFRALGETVAGELGKEYLIVVVPRHDNVRDTNRYIKLIAYNVLLDAQQRGRSPETLYSVIACDDPLDAAPVLPANTPAPVLVLHSSVLSQDPICGPGFIQQVEARYPGSTVQIADIPSLPQDLAPAKP